MPSASYSSALFTAGTKIWTYLTWQEQIKYVVPLFSKDVSLVLTGLSNKEINKGSQSFVCQVPHNYGYHSANNGTSRRPIVKDKLNKFISSLSMVIAKLHDGKDKGFREGACKIQVAKGIKDGGGYPASTLLLICSSRGLSEGICGVPPKRLKGASKSWSTKPHFQQKMNILYV
ncbi:hypothetical protein EDB85DRAFT_1894488 [Lactarius pseudohatsudake]|nr:hypothetical protein EDB85DRAFT_1894488 [Lactarius pseudohatsudake]